jgi:hypothetical protein
MTNVWTRWGIVAVTLSAALFGVSDAEAERIVLLQFSGRKASVLRQKVEESLERAGHTVVRSKASSRKLSKRTIKRVGKRADVVVGGQVERAREGDWSMFLSVNDPKTGEQLGENVEFESHWLPGITKDLTDNVSRRVEAVMAGEADVPVVPEPEPEPDADLAASSGGLDDDSRGQTSEPAPSEASSEGDEVASSGEDGVSDSGVDEPSADDPFGDGGMVVRLRARGGFVRRNFDFADDIYDRLRKQGTNIWTYQAQAEVYPFERPIGQRLGLILSYEGSFAGSVLDVDNNSTFPVIYSEFYGGVRARHPLGKHQVGFDLTFGRMNSGLEDSNNAADIPDMEYTLLRASLDFKLDLGAVNATASAGFRLPLGFGQASEADWFPRIGGYGIEASGGLEYPLSRRLSIEALGSLRRYLLEMNSTPADAMAGVAEVAGGAVDLYLSLYLGASFKL